ncbi:hypothetical protein BU16DRAFT_535398 [Lophium mytilinum]|uniref:Uncharacterized protein n=1 Tax=Lophium mytilinum TaxID=390894 RepID=A0A6A6R8F5_9PEZI|nr:hypothetical protein BU16DRAFT_535398 [Lophium mytilinum]
MKRPHEFKEEKKLQPSRKRVARKLLRNAYASDRAASLHLAKRFLEVLPRELRDLIYKAVFPESVRIQSGFYPKRIETAQMMGRPRYLFPAYVGRQIATEALEEFYKAVLFRFEHISRTEIWAFLHEDVFGLGIVARTLVRRLWIQEGYGLGNACSTTLYELPRWWGPDLYYERKCIRELETEWKLRNHIRYLLGNLSTLHQPEKRELTVEIACPHMPEFPELRHMSPMLFELREKGWKINLACSGRVSGEQTTQDVTSFLEPPTDIERQHVLGLIYTQQFVVSNLERLEYWYRVHLHDHYAMYKKMRSRELCTQDIQLSPDTMSRDEWRKICDRTFHQETERAQEGLKEVEWANEILILHTDAGVLARDVSDLARKFLQIRADVDQLEATERSRDTIEASLSGAEREAYVSEVEGIRRLTRRAIRMKLFKIQELGKRRTSIWEDRIAANSKFESRWRVRSKEDEERRRIGLEVKRRERREIRGLRNI